MSRLDEALQPYLDLIEQLPSRVSRAVEVLSEEPVTNLDQYPFSRSILRTLKVHFVSQYEVNSLLDKRYSAPAADTFVETVLLHLKGFVASYRASLHVCGERSIVRRRGAPRPDISVWSGDKLLAAIECKTNLGWDREGWQDRHEGRLRAIRHDFPLAAVYLVVLTAENWPGFDANDDRVGSEWFTLSGRWPSDYEDENWRDCLLHPIEPLFQGIMELDGAANAE